MNDFYIFLVVKILNKNSNLGFYKILNNIYINLRTFVSYNRLHQNFIFYKLT